MSKSFKINGELIRSSGKKLKMVGYLMIGSIVVLILYFVLISNSRDMDFIQSMGVLTAATSLLITILIIKNIIESGSAIFSSVQTNYEDVHNEGMFVDGKSKDRDYNDNRINDVDIKKKNIGIYKDGKKDGMWVEYYPNGRLESKGLYVNGVEDGLWVYYHENGELRRKGNFRNGKLDGLWEFYRQDGTQNISTSGLYYNGKKVR